jgi:hypothetical protein
MHNIPRRSSLSYNAYIGNSLIKRKGELTDTRLSRDDGSRCPMQRATGTCLKVVVYPNVVSTDSNL